ncbi:MAG TPA: response regulator [Candidatus Saccharimonadales bacterium]|nr:response regulator [Candidatus Saccharimonadales bacterium]
MSFLRDVTNYRRTRRVLVAHRSPTATKSIASVLAEFDGMGVAGVAYNLTQCLAMTEIVRPDIVLFEQDMAGENLAPVIGWIKSKVPSASVVIISTLGGAELRLRCLEAGADYFCKETIKLSSLSDVIGQFEDCSTTASDRYGL